MRRQVLLAVAPFALAGCLTPVTSRLDRANEQLLLANERLACINARLEESQRQLARVNAQLAQTDQRLADANRTLGRVEGRLDELNKKITGFGKIFPRFPVLGP